MLSVEKPIVVLDACVLIPMPLCDTLLRAVDQSMYRFYTSPKILEETQRNLAKLLKKTQNLDSSVADKKAKRRIDQIQKVFPEALVDPSDNLISTLENDPKDRHVLAAAIEAQKIATDSGFHRLVLIVTHNLRHFPKNILSKYNVVAISPDDFLLKLVKIYDSSLLFNLLQQQAEDNKHEVFDLLERLEKGKVNKFVNLILTDYYLGKTVEELSYLISKFGQKDEDNNQCLNGKTYQLILTNYKFIINHYKKGIIFDSNCYLISTNHISCKDFQELKLFIDQAEKITATVK